MTKDRRKTVGKCREITRRAVLHRPDIYSEATQRDMESRASFEIEKGVPF